MKTKPNYVMLMVLALLMATTTGFAQKSKKMRMLMLPAIRQTQLQM